MIRIKNLIFLLCLVFGLQFTTFAQTSFTCEVDGDEFHGEIKESLLVNLGKENYIQVKLENGGKIMYMYLKASKLNGGLPAKLEYKPHDAATNQTPDAEIVWVPDGPDEPAWNAIEGYAEVVSFNPETKTLSGNFNFMVEKAVYGSKKNSETVEITDGKFLNLVYKLESKTK